MFGRHAGKTCTRFHAGRVGSVLYGVSSPSDPSVAGARRLSQVLTRLKAVAEGRSYARMAADLDLHPETVRRYLLHGPPCVNFLLALNRCGYSIDWIIAGLHGMQLRDHPKALREISTAELLAEIGRRLQAQEDAQRMVTQHIAAIQARLVQVERSQNGDIREVKAAQEHGSNALA